MHNLSNIGSPIRPFNRTMPLIMKICKLETSRKYHTLKVRKPISINSVRTSVEIVPVKFSADHHNLAHYRFRSKLSSDAVSGPLRNGSRENYSVNRQKSYNKELTPNFRPAATLARSRGTGTSPSPPKGFNFPRHIRHIGTLARFKLSYPTGFPDKMATSRCKTSRESSHAITFKQTRESGIRNR